MRDRCLMTILMALFGLLLVPHGMWAQTSYGISIKHAGTFTPVTSANAGDVLGDGGTVSYQNGVLTLNGATIEGCIYSVNDLTINVVGDNFIIATDSFCIKNPKPEQDALIHQTFPPVSAGQLVINTPDASCSLLLRPCSSYSSIGYFANITDPILKQTNNSWTKSCLYASQILGGGDGSSNYPYLIKTARDLNNLSRYVNALALDTDGKYVSLESSIDCSSLTSYESIGCRRYRQNNQDDTSFRGTFDGNGNTISGLKYNPQVIDPQMPEAICLFSYLGGTLTNLKLFDCKFGGGYMVGAITDFFEGGGSINNCIISDCTIEGDDQNCGTIGGIAGNPQRGSIAYCSVVNCNILNGTNMGGIAGESSGTSIEHCTVEGTTISGTMTITMGGIVARNGGPVSDCVVKKTEIIGINGANAGAIVDDANTSDCERNYYYADVTVKVGSVEKSGYTQRGAGNPDPSGNYDIFANDGAVLRTRELSFPSDNHCSIAEVAGTYYKKIGTGLISVAPPLTTKLEVTPIGNYVPSAVTVTYTPTGGTQTTLTPDLLSKTGNTYTYSFEMPDAAATFSVTSAVNLESSSFSYQIASCTYTGSAVVLPTTIAVTDATGGAGMSLTQDTDYTIEGYKDSNNTALNAAPINTGTYTVIIKGKGNYTGTASVTFNIVKAAGTISYASGSVNKTFGDAAFTNALTKTGDGTVSYSSSNTAVATVNATTGEVTIVGVGSSVITATVTDGANYTYSPNTATYTLTVGSASMNVSASGYTGKYDGQAHGIKVTAPDGATVKYGEHDGTYDLNTSPAYTNAGSYTVYYQVTKPGYNPVTGSATVVISKADAKVKYVNYEFSAKIGENFDPPYLTLDPSDLVVSYYSYDTSVATVDAQTGEVTLVAPGTVNIYASFAGNENYNSASDYYILTVLQRDIEPIDEDVTITMKDDDFLTTNDEGQQEEIRLDNTVIYDILYTLNIVGDPSECDGYDETEHCVVLNHPMTSKEINRIVSGSLEPGSEAYADAYTGLTFKVPDGKGYVIIDSKTDGNYQMMVKIGTLAPVAFNHTGREKDSVFYECSKPTWVYVYDGGMVSNARMAVDHRAKKTKGHVKIYSVTRSSSQAAGIERVNSDALESDRWYDLQGNRIQRPMKKGLYILKGRKVIVR